MSEDQQQLFERCWKAARDGRVDEAIGLIDSAFSAEQPPGTETAVVLISALIAVDQLQEATAAAKNFERATGSVATAECGDASAAAIGDHSVNLERLESALTMTGAAKIRRDARPGLELRVTDPEALFEGGVSVSLDTNGIAVRRQRDGFSLQWDDIQNCTLERSEAIGKTSLGNFIYERRVLCFETGHRVHRLDVSRLNPSFEFPTAIENAVAKELTINTQQIKVSDHRRPAGKAQLEFAGGWLAFSAFVALVTIGILTLLD